MRRRADRYHAHGSGWESESTGLTRVAYRAPLQLVCTSVSTNIARSPSTTSPSGSRWPPPAHEEFVVNTKRNTGTSSTRRS